METLDQVSRQVITEANLSTAPGRRALGVLVFGSYADGAARPGSDIDIQIVTENAATPGRGLPDRLREEWAKRGTGIDLDSISLTYVPPDPGLLIRLHPEALRVLSPYPGMAGGLSHVPPPGLPPANLPARRPHDPRGTVAACGVCRRPGDIPAARRHVGPQATFR